jgi:carboxypeptidase Taq
MELERALMGKQIQVAEVPGLWRDKVRLLLGLDVPGPAAGPLQDIHWSFGVFGYFPTYTLGNLYAAQFFARAREDLGNLPALVATGDFAPLLGWLREKIHSRGSLLPPGELCREVTGSPLSCRPFVEYLENKFEEIYEL